MPDSWLVIYNTNDPLSSYWATNYHILRGVPLENMIGVDASLDEHLPTFEDATIQIIDPVRQFLATHPEIEEKIMGILVGYHVPGTYGTPPSGGPGGYSIPDALEDMTDDDELPGDQKGLNNHDNPQFLDPPQLLPPGGRLTKATMQEGRYMVARIDGPTVIDAIQISNRSIAFENSHPSMAGQHVYYDYIDPIALPQGEWHWLRKAVEEPALADLPWQEFDSDTETTPLAAIRFGTHDLTGWNDSRLYGGAPGVRILAFNYDSFGATTVRSTTAQGGRYVPNALAAGYLAAIGSTGEPYCCLGPVPETLLAGLREGWTIGESFHIASVYDDWMWTLFADPLMRVPRWFNQLPDNAGTGDGNGDGVVNGRDIAILSAVLTGDITDPDTQAAYDLSGDGLVNEDDAFLILGPVLLQTNDPDALRGGGDLNGDGVVNGRDLTTFVTMLVEGEDVASLRARLTGDMDENGVVDLDDVELFVDAALLGHTTRGKSCHRPPKPTKPRGRFGSASSAKASDLISRP